jgi:hypothetical protein
MLSIIIKKGDNNMKKFFKITGIATLVSVVAVVLAFLGFCAYIELSPEDDDYDFD